MHFAFEKGEEEDEEEGPIIQTEEEVFKQRCFWMLVKSEFL